MPLLLKFLGGAVVFGAVAYVLPHRPRGRSRYRGIHLQSPREVPVRRNLVVLSVLLGCVGISAYLAVVCVSHATNGYRIVIKNSSAGDVRKMVLEPKERADRIAGELRFYSVLSGASIVAELPVMADNSYSVVCEFADGRLLRAVIGYTDGGGFGQFELLITDSSIDVNWRPLSLVDVFRW